MPKHAAIRAVFRRQAATCGKLGSPVTAGPLDLLAHRLSDDTLHALVLTRASTDLVDAYPPNPLDSDKAVDGALSAHREAVLRFLESPSQTNEVARSAALTGGFLTVAALPPLPLALVEIGASAGLNLL